MSWMMLGSLFSRIASLVAQLGLAKLLAKDDFGLYATAIGVAGFVTAFRDSGVSMYLIRHGLRDYAKLAAEQQCPQTSQHIATMFAQKPMIPKQLSTLLEQLIPAATSYLHGRPRRKIKGEFFT